LEVFLSHSSRDKPLVREIRNFLPEYIHLWIDEFELHSGSDLKSNLREAIKKTDLLIVFFTPEAVESGWVRRELKWALSQEKRLGRNFIIPVIFNETCWLNLPKNFQKRIYIPFNDFTEEGVKALSRRLYNEMFSYFLQNIEFITEQELHDRKSKVSEIVRKLLINKSNIIRNGALTNSLLKEIIANIDPLNRLLLLALYEMYKTSNEIPFEKTKESKPFRSLEFHIPQVGSWVHKINWDSKKKVYRELTYEYNLGNSNKLVRDEFLTGIKNLTESERSEMFYGIKTVEIFSEW
jgi:hypothetical protein